MDIKKYSIVDIKINDIKNITSEELDIIYVAAYQLYESGHKEDAECVFRLLCSLRYNDARFFLALGRCQQYQGDYLGALKTYNYASLILPSNPHFPFGVGECWFYLNEFNAAKQALTSVCSLVKTDPDYTALVEKAGKMLSVVKIKMQTVFYSD